MKDAAGILARYWDHLDPVHYEPDSGLINQTWTVGEPAWGVLQWVNPIFDPAIHKDIEAFTARLEEVGLTTPRLLPTRQGDLCAVDATGCWRLMTYIPGRTLHRLASSEQAAAAGDLVGRFHRALAGWVYTIQAPRRHIHDTTFHMAELHGACAEIKHHPLSQDASALGSEILARWAEWGTEMPRDHRFSHGDLKISNLRFEEEDEIAVCLIDLDTLGSMPISCEMGDAWRSWCNPAGEDDPSRVVFDLGLFESSARAWLASAPPLNDEELTSLVPGIERICLELAARFCADALHNTYFRENRERHPQRGSHNLLRARAQLALANSARQQRAECETIVASASDRLTV
ncbi:MAG: phosphotransferase [Acidobacteriota bacterium]